MRGTVAALLLVGLLASLAPAQAPRRYSGKVEEVDLERGLVTVTVLGARGRAERHSVQVEPETSIVSAGRLRPRDMRGPYAFGEVRVSLADVLVGDFVVVEYVDEEEGEVARHITIVEVGKPAGR